MAKTNYNTTFDVNFFKEIFTSALKNFLEDFLDLIRENNPDMIDEEEYRGKFDSVIADEDLLSNVIYAYLANYNNRISKYGLEADHIWHLTIEIFSMKTKMVDESLDICNGGNLIACSSNKIEGESIMKVVAC